MSKIEPYEDPVLAANARAWMQSSAPDAAPERLVFSVMDEVARSPRYRRVPLFGRPGLVSIGRYVALTLVIAIGVAAGIVISTNIENASRQSPPPTPASSLRLGGEVASDARLIASDAARAWIVTRGNELVPIAPAGTRGEPITITYVASDVIARTDPGPTYGGPETVWLVAPDGDLLRIDPIAGEFVAVPGVRGSRVTLGGRAAWVSRTGEVLKIDPAQMQYLASFNVPDHRAEDPVLVVGNELWVGTASGIERLDAGSGNRRTAIPIAASSLVSAGGVIWAGEGTRLVGIDPTSATSTRTATLPIGTADIVALATHGDVVWLATGSGPNGPMLVGVDAVTGQVVSTTPLATPAISVAAVGNQVWTLDAGGRVVRFEPGS